MTARIIVTGTDTGIGKTVFAAGLTRLLDGYYFKPVQAGLGEETDTAVVQRLSALPVQRMLPEVWRLNTPASPHLAAERDGVIIDPTALNLPTLDRPLIVEGAGGLMVPLTRNELYIDLFATWRAPVVLCARTALGTLNHTLLSLEALQRRGIPVLGIALIGDVHADNERTLREMGRVPILGTLPLLNPLTPQSLGKAFSVAFARESFTATAAP
ncbi:MAG TPA: dethiobiotin synthase [Steroidobacteraceae bacterium]|nr:dethiobiotin synthase [Steroidobacteraceae bacterium]